mmetsp:Transcript_4723/g.11679  ORF Transcript_4723/g.11679 Transcript_4723/m.11679 type:complete len:259 (-) Transcript_4723:185-961(-)
MRGRHAVGDVGRAHLAALGAIAQVDAARIVEFADSDHVLLILFPGFRNHGPALACAEGARRAARSTGGGASKVGDFAREEAHAQVKTLHIRVHEVLIFALPNGLVASRNRRRVLGKIATHAEVLGAGLHAGAHGHAVPVAGAILNSLALARLQDIRPCLASVLLLVGRLVFRALLAHLAEILLLRAQPGLLIPRAFFATGIALVKVHVGAVERNVLAVLALFAGGSYAEELKRAAIVALHAIVLILRGNRDKRGKQSR